MTDWKYITGGREFNRVMLDGINVWKHAWREIGAAPVTVKDPRYGQDFYFAVYEISYRGKTVVFAAGEFSNGVWEFYQRILSPRSNEEL
jgi:hypothetical protein